MERNFPGGVWPVMLTPFHENGEVDYEALKGLVEWYIKNGSSGLFAVCQSSEMFFLTLEERKKIGSIVVEAANGRVPVIVSGHVSEEYQKQVEEIKEMSKTGADAVILITNRLAKEEESEEVWWANCEKLLRDIDPQVPLGFYECPYPYKRLLSVENIKRCANTGRFYFLKDTCCDLEGMKEKLTVIKGSRLKLYNANTSTLLESLKAGAAGYSGVMANFHPSLYVWLCRNYQKEEAKTLADRLTILSLIERQCYPVNAKHYLRRFENLPITETCRVRKKEELTVTFQEEISMLERITRSLEKQFMV